MPCYSKGKITFFRTFGKFPVLKCSHQYVSIYTCIEFDKTSFSQTMKNANWGVIRSAWPEYFISRFLQKKLFALVIFWAFTLLLTDNTRFSLALHYEFLGIWKLSRKKKKPKSDEHENNRTFGIITLWH